MQADGRARVVIEGVSPCVDGGAFPAKGAIGERIAVEADVFTDGHDMVACALLHRRAGDASWSETPMTPLVNDRWRGEFAAASQGLHEFTIHAWVDRFGTWRRDTEKKIAAGQDIGLDLVIGATLLDEAAERADGRASRELRALAESLRAPAASPTEQAALALEALEPSPRELMRRHAERRFKTELGESLAIVVDRERARFSSWYELFPRSASPTPGRHGTLRDVEARLPEIAAMGFDVLYLPPIHPIGRVHRKGRNNAPEAAPGDVGSPWAIGAPEGGHKSVHPDLGTLEDFDHLVNAAADHGMELALDIAYQCAPDHPYVREHPEWFRHRPDGTIQYAENPPKKYQDIYPFDFECEDWEALWDELKSVVLFWAARGVRIFRVDNPHTKPFPFWEWLIPAVKREYPDALFLAEAFTRPKVMKRLAKLGFTQSYTYFAWRNEAWELEQYFTELTATDVADYFRPNAWPNTPDILTEFLQQGGRPAAVIRLILAATLCANYGVYGPPFELVETTPREPGSEEYLDSEKYQLRTWDHDRPGSLRDLITRINRIRRAHPALQQDRTLKFHRAENPALLCYSKTADDGSDAIICAVNTDPRHTHWGAVELDLEAIGVDPERPFQVHDLLTDARYVWRGARNIVGLDPASTPAHIFRIRTGSRSERDFEHYL